MTTDTPDATIDPAATDETLIVPNDEFMSKLFPTLSGTPGEPRPVVASIGAGPNAPGTGWGGCEWGACALPATNNNYFCLSLFNQKADGGYSRQKQFFHAVCSFVFDDIGTKVPFKLITAPPSWVLETSPGNFQVGYLLTEPVTNGDKANAFMNAAIAAGLSDKGANQPCTRLMRLPVGANGKHDPAFPCRLTVWAPELRYSVEELIDRYRLDLEKEAPPREKGTPQEEDTLAAHVLAALRERGWYKTELGTSRHEVTCPWTASHTGEADNGAYYYEPDGQHPYGGYKCFHAHCVDRHVRDLLHVLDIQLGFPSLIPLDSPILPSMPLDVLPSSLNDMVQAVAAHTETPPELAAGFGLAAVATACQQRFVVEMEPGYREPINIWTVTTLESGSRKTAVANEMIAPLLQVEREECTRIQSEIVTIESQRETIKAKVKVLRDSTAKKQGFEDFEKRKQEIAQLESALPEVPTLPRFVVQDITPEKLGQVMAENGERISLISDEGGIFDTLAGRYSNGIPNLDLFLQGHAGSPVRVHRGSRPDVVMDRPALTMALSPQPSVLQGLATQSAFRGRGLLARILYALPFSRLGYRNLTTQPIPPSVKNLFHSTITTLLKIEPVKDASGQVHPHVLTISSEAHDEWKTFQRTVEAKMRDGGDYEHIRDWAGKLPGAAARLAGLLHCVEHAETLLSTLTISLSTMQQALALAAFYQAHALAAFDAMGADYDLHAARHVWRWMERVKKNTFTARECFQALRGTYKKMEKLNPAFPLLIERGYLIEQEPPPETAGKPGRKKRIFLVNPDALKVSHE